MVGSGPSRAAFPVGLLKHELTIGCNDEYLWGPTIALAQDPRIFRGDGSPDRTPLCRDPAWTHGNHIPVYFKGHPHREDVEAPDSVFQVESAHDLERPFRWGQSLEEGLYYGANVGMAAINLAEILGSREIYLIGFDASWKDSRTHHHDRYPDNWRMSNEVDRKVVYGRWIKEFRKIAGLTKAKVVNLNPASGIDAFPKMRPMEAFLRMKNSEGQPLHDVWDLLKIFDDTPDSAVR